MLGLQARLCSKQTRAHYKIISLWVILNLTCFKESLLNIPLESWNNFGHTLNHGIAVSLQVTPCPTSSRSASLRTRRSWCWKSNPTPRKRAMTLNPVHSGLCFMNFEKKVSLTLGCMVMTVTNQGFMRMEVSQSHFIYSTCMVWLISMSILNWMVSS